MARHASLDVARHGFHNDDGVIDDDADREHNSEESRQIDGKSERGHSSECADDCDGNCRGRNKRCPEILQKGEDHHKDESACFIKRMIDLLD